MVLHRRSRMAATRMKTEPKPLANQNRDRKDRSRLAGGGPICGSSIPAYSTAAREGPRLGDLAFALAEADKVILDFIVLYLEVDNSNSAPTQLIKASWSTRGFFQTNGFPPIVIPAVAMSRLRRVAMELADCRTQLDDCMNGSQYFHREYLCAKGLLEYWNIHRSIQKAIIDGGEIDPTSITTELPTLQPMFQGTMNDSIVAFTRDGVVNPQFQQLEAALQNMNKHLEAAAKRSLLTCEQKHLIQDRYTVIDDIFHSLESARSNRVFARKTLCWPKLAEQIGFSVTQQKPIEWTNVMMWATVILSGIGSLPTFALVLKYSNPDTGTTSEPDFWFLLQTCLKSFLDIVMLAIPMSRGSTFCDSNNIAAWASIAVAIGCTVTAPFLYLCAPTAWATFLTIIAGMFRAWLVVQLAIGTKEKKSGIGDKHLKTE